MRMSITPIEEGGDHGHDEPSEASQSSGVRNVVGAVLAGFKRAGRRFVARLRDPFGVAPGAGYARRGSQLRVSGQRRLTAARESGTENGRDEPRALPDGTTAEAEKEDDSLRVYDPDRSEAYISSDTWETVER